ncbi:MAG: sulfurtransferase [Cellvibrio sp.]
MSALPLLVTGKALAPHLQDENLLILDVGKLAIYEQAHLPGAIHVDYRLLQKGDMPAPGFLPSEDALVELFSSVGLTPNTHVVAYDDEGGTRSARLLWVLDAIGHTRYSLLDGGIHAWLEDDLPYQVEPNYPTPSNFSKADLNIQAQVDLAYLMANYNRADVVIWDARTFEEYIGQRVVAARAGHIPGAVHYNWETCIDRNIDNRVRNLDTIRAELANLGITGDKEIITHCQTHHRSSFSWFIGKVLGFENIRAYPGAWSEWGNHPETPIVKTPH